jgi:predicted DNA-binding transcriptional regulator YafY
LRTYRISRIVHAEVLNESFSRSMDFNLEKYWEHSTAQFKQNLPRYPAKIRISEHLLDLLEKDRYLTVQQIETAGNGWAEAIIEFATLDHGCEKVISFGSFVEVIAPTELRTKVISENKLSLTCIKGI